MGGKGTRILKGLLTPRDQRVYLHEKKVVESVGSLFVSQKNYFG